MSNETRPAVDIADLEADLNLFHDEELSMGYPCDAGDAARIQRRFVGILNKHFTSED